MSKNIREKGNFFNSELSELRFIKNLKKICFLKKRWIFSDEGQKL